MPMPNVQVLLSFLEVYFKIREEDNKTYSGWAKNIINSTWNMFDKAKSLLGMDNNPNNLTEDDRQTLITNYKAKFEAAKKTSDWAKVIVDLGADARIAQSVKYLPGDSKLALTLHAIRNYIISELNKDEILRTEYAKEINDRLIELNVGFEAKDGQQAKLSLRAQHVKDDREGVPNKASRTNLDNMLLALADLGHEASLTESLNLLLNVLKYSKPKATTLSPGRINPNHPFCYQKNYDDIFFTKYSSKFPMDSISNNAKLKPSNDRKLEKSAEYNAYIQKIVTASSLPSEEELAKRRADQQEREKHLELEKQKELEKQQELAKQEELAKEELAKQELAKQELEKQKELERQLELAKQEELAKQLELQQKQESAKQQEQDNVVNKSVVAQKNPDNEANIRSSAHKHRSKKQGHSPKFSFGQAAQEEEDKLLAERLQAKEDPSYVPSSPALRRSGESSD